MVDWNLLYVFVTFPKANDITSTTININKLNNIIILVFFCNLLIFKLYLKYKYLKINTLLTVIPIPVAAKGPYTCKNAVNGNCIITLTIIPIFIYSLK